MPRSQWKGLMSLPWVSKAFLGGYQENHKVRMATRFLNEDVKTAGSTKDIRVYIYPDLNSI